MDCGFPSCLKDRFPGGLPVWGGPANLCILTKRRTASYTDSLPPTSIAVACCSLSNESLHQKSIQHEGLSPIPAHSSYHRFHNFATCDWPLPPRIGVIERPLPESRYRGSAYSSLFGPQYHDVQHISPASRRGRAGCANEDPL